MEELTYGLEKYYESSQINKRLERAPKFKRGPIRFELYPLEQLQDNAMKFMNDEILFERQQVFRYYYNQGFLGKTLMYVIDHKLIEGVRNICERLLSKGSDDLVRRQEESLFEPYIMIHDHSLVQKSQHLKVLRNLSK